jgi:hypothetical protein
VSCERRSQMHERVVHVRNVINFRRLFHHHHINKTSLLR